MDLVEGVQAGPRLAADGLARAEGAQGEPREVAVTVGEAEEVLPGLVVERARVAWANGDGELRVRLRPPELGTIRVVFAARDGVLTGSIAVEREEVREWVETQLPAWQESVESTGLRVERLDVSLLPDGADGGEGGDALPWGERAPSHPAQSMPGQSTGPQADGGLVPRGASRLGVNLSRHQGGLDYLA